LVVKSLVICGLMFAVGLAGFAAETFDGFKFRIGKRADYYDFLDNSRPELRYRNKTNLAEKIRSDCDFYNTQAYYEGHATWFPLPSINSTCYTRDLAYKKAVFIWGDSHAQHLNYGLTQNLPSTWQVLQVASSGCGPEVNNAVDTAQNYCNRSNSFALQTIKDSKPDVVIVAQDGGHDVEKFDAMASELHRLGVKKVVVAGPTPHWKAELPTIVVRKFFDKTPRRTYVGIDMAVIAKNQELRKHFEQTGQVQYADLIETFCNRDGCLVFIGDDEKNGITSYDDAHLTPIASDYLAKSLLVSLIVWMPQQ
jgi:SGNH domain (fused to AT3 domains)